MKKTRLVIPELEKSLVFWEDLFLISRLQKKFLKNRDINLAKPMTSIKDFSYLNSINYEDFRKSIYDKNFKIEIDKFLDFCSTVSEFQNNVEAVRAAGSGVGVESIFFFPYILNNWFKTKKVFHLEDPGDIPLMNPDKKGIRDIFSRKNFLHLMPCDHFLIKFGIPAQYGFESAPVVYSYSSCLVTRSGDIIDSYWIPDDIDSKSLSQEARSLVKKLLFKKRAQPRESKKLFKEFSLVNFSRETTLIKKDNKFLAKSVEPIAFFRLSIDLKRNMIYLYPGKNSKEGNTDIKLFYPFSRGNSVTYIEDLSSGKITKHLEPENKTSEFDKLKNQDMSNLRYILSSFLNGFCYSLSQIPQKNLKVYNDSKEKNSGLKHMDFLWNEVPVNQVQYLEKNNEIEGNFKISYGSGEVSPHVRRGHWRNIIRKDGTSYRIWIESTIVRADKLDKDEELKGSATVVRKSRKT